MLSHPAALPRAVLRYPASAMCSNAVKQMITVCSCRKVTLACAHAFMLPKTPTLMSAHFGACHDVHVHNDLIAPCGCKHPTFVSSPICDIISYLLRPCRSSLLL